MWMWLGIAMITTVTLGWFGWALVAIGDDDDDELMRRYEQERAAFERMFE